MDEEEVGSLNMEKENSDDVEDNTECYPEEQEQHKDKLLDEHMSKVR